MRLNDYFHKHILEPMGLKNIDMFPSPEMKKTLAYMHARTPGKCRGKKPLAFCVPSRCPPFVQRLSSTARLPDQLSLTSLAPAQTAN